MTPGTTDTGRRACERCVADLPSSPHRPSMRINEMIEKAAKFHGVTIQTLKSKTRVRNMVLARNSVFKVLKDQGLTFESIGKIFNRDHSTIMHGLTMLRNDIETNKAIRTLHNAMVEHIYK